MPKKSAKQPVETTPVETTPMETAPVETTPVETTSVDVTKSPAVGRTLLVKTSTNISYDFTGLLNKAETKSSNTVFLTFDTKENSSAAYQKLVSMGGDVKVKYSYYRVFFTMSGLTDTSDYNMVKKDMTEMVESKTGSSVLYFKLYRKNSSFIGCGDFTLDTMEGMNKLLSKENNNKDYQLGSHNGTFYRYTSTKTQ